MLRFRKFSDFYVRLVDISHDFLLIALNLDESVVISSNAFYDVINDGHFVSEPFNLVGVSLDEPQDKTDQKENDALKDVREINIHQSLP